MELTSILNLPVALKASSGLVILVRSTVTSKVPSTPVISALIPLLDCCAEGWV